MLSDEERKAIDYLQLCYDLSTITNESLSKLCIVLNLIEKQSKEIEELKQEKEYLNCIIESDEDNYINKDKIKAKIEEYKKLINECPMNDEEIFCKECTEKCGFNQTIDVLQSLLEKE